MKSVESRIQDLVYNVDSGIGLRLIKVLLYILAVGSVVLLYTANQFRGLREAEAMDYAQLGRNVTIQSPWLVTQTVRPASLGYLIRNTDDPYPSLHQHPDIVHPPVYPILLNLFFRGANFAATPQGSMHVYGPEHRVMVLNHIFALLTGIFVLLLGRRLFDPTIGMLGMTLYYLSDSVWRTSLGGTGVAIASFWGVAAIYAMVIAVSRITDGARLRRWIGPVIVAGLLCSLAFLTRYAAIVLVPGLMIYLGWALRQRAWQGLAIFLLVFMIPASLWIARNAVVAGGPFGLAPYLALNETRDYPGNAFERTLATDTSFVSILAAAREKLLPNFSAYYDTQLMGWGDGLLMALFITTFFYRFVRFPVHSLRWGLALSMVLLLFVGAVYGESAFRLAQMFWPLIILYGLAFFMLLLERLQLPYKFLNRGMIGVVLFLTALPLIFTLMPPRAGPTYPPYAPRLIAMVTQLLRPQEAICSDMPWANAWYGDRTSLLLPVNVETFYDIHDFHDRLSGLYFTLKTRDLPLISGLQAPEFESWRNVMEGRLPADFPLPQATTLAGVDQLFFSDRPRWAE